MATLKPIANVAGVLKELAESDILDVGRVDVTRTGSNDTHVVARGPTGQIQHYWFFKGAYARWVMFCYNDAESGGNVGSKLVFAGYLDDGSTQVEWLEVERATGNALVPERNWKFRINSIGTGSNPSVTQANEASAANGAQQYSPAHELIGSGYNTGSGNAVQPVKIRTQLRPVQGSGSTEDPNHPTGDLIWLWSVDGGGFTEFASLSSKGLMQLAGLLANSPTKGIGYRTGAGGTVTQATSKSTGVTLNKTCGQITMNNAALAAAAEVSFTLTNSAIAANDVIVVNVKSGATANTYMVCVNAVAAGSCSIMVGNMSTTSRSEAIVLSFAVIKAVNA